MHAMESSDRRLKWESVAETIEVERPYGVVADRVFGPGYFLEETTTSLQLTGARASGVSLLACVFEGGRWVDVTFEYSELTHVTFRHVYFQAVDFRGANLRHVRFEHCVFSECPPPEGEAIEKTACFFREGATTTAPIPVLDTGHRDSTDPARPETLAKVVSPPPDRFDGLER